jgi:anti-sigma B factor antagonist
VASDPRPHLEAQSWRLGRLHVLRLVGELDVLTAHLVQVRLDEALPTFDELTLIVDLTRVTFIASAGVGALLELRQKISDRQGRLVVVFPRRSNPWRLFELTGMISVFEVRQSLQEAVRALRQQIPSPAPSSVASDMP